MEKINNIIFSIIVFIIIIIIYNIFFNNDNNNDIDTFTNSELLNNNITIYNFSSTKCGYCKQFQPTWDEFTKSIKDYKNISALDIKCDKQENNNICNKYNIPGFPTVLIKLNDNIILYDGPRSVDGLHKALLKINTPNNIESNNIEHNNKLDDKIKIYNFNTEWCGYSKKFEPIWNDFVLSLSNDELNKINPINVKCDNESNNELCNKYNIPGYPFVMIIDNSHIIPYSGPRTVEGLRKALHLPNNTLPNDTLPNNNKVIIYNFNTEWCGYSKQFQPIWDKFANSLSDQEKQNYNIVDIKCDNEKNKEICNKYKINGFPSVIIINNTNIKDYNGPRTFDGLRSIIVGKKIKIYNFNTEWCGYSKQFQPIWNTFYNSIKINDNIEAFDVKCDNNKNKDLCIKYNIEGFPTIIIDNNSNVTKYTGPRTLEGLKKAVNL